MLGLFGTLNLGASSLAAQQTATEVAGQNLANVNNPAYSRQRVQLQAATPLLTAIGMEGTGVTAVTIAQVRDLLLDQQITSETSVGGSLNAQQLALQNLQAALGERIDSNATNTQGATSSGSSQNGLAEGLDNLFSAFQSLSTDPSSLTQRQVLLQAAQGLATQFNQVSAGLATVRTGLNNSIQSDVGQGNQLLSDIANLNQKIIQSEAATGGTANDLRDLRQQKLETLANLVNITTTAEPNGGMDISVGGVTMVSGMKSVDSLQTYDAGGGQILVRAQNAGTPLTLTGGSVQGNIDVRDGALAALQNQTDTLAAQLITQVNTVHAAGFDLNGGTGQNFFSGTDAASISVNAALMTDPSKIQASGTGAAGDNKVALSLAQLADKTVAALNNQTFSQSFSATVANVGQSLASANDQVGNQTAVSNMLSAQRDSVSGVSIDEEMTDMLKFQKAYEASAKLVATISNMLETVVSMKT